MAPRSIATASITFGLVSIPVRLFPATSPKSVSFNLLHAKDNSRIQQKIYCPVDDALVERSELVRGYEIEKGRYVTFTEDEIKKLEATENHAVEISEFVPIAEIDPVSFDKSYLLGCEATSARAYRLLAKAMINTGMVGVATMTMRGKENLVIIRNYADGLMLHTMYYRDELRSFSDIDHGVDAPTKESEIELANRLVADLSEKKFDPAKYTDGFRERVIDAAQQKLSGHEVTEAPPEMQRGKVIDLMDALKASLKKRGVEVSKDRVESDEESEADEHVAQAAKGRARRRAR